MVVDYLRKGVLQIVVEVVQVEKKIPDKKRILLRKLRSIASAD